NAGPNAKRDTRKNGDDTVAGETLTTGPDGICQTVANAVNGPAPGTAPAAADVERYLNEVWGKQANVFFTVTRTDHTLNYDLDLDGKLDDPYEIPGVGRKMPPQFDEINQVRTVKDTTVDYNIYYVHAYEYPIGLTVMDEVFSDASGANTPLNHTAHEVGHLLGRNGESNDILDVMYKFGDASNPCRVVKHDWDLVNP
ncbi:MAG TPA: hypothetical protein VMS21_11370, partial [Methylomirabilota bacterium]|nr:hypothetical protein [Methylomirabilota bacterium]